MNDDRLIIESLDDIKVDTSHLYDYKHHYGAMVFKEPEPLDLSAIDTMTEAELKKSLSKLLGILYLRKILSENEINEILS